MNLRALFLTLLLAAPAAIAADAPPAAFNSNFVQTRTLPGFDAPLTSRGNMRYDKVHGFHWEITAPYHYVFEMNGQSAHEELPDGTKRDLDPDQNPWLAAVEHIFISALSGDRAELMAYFDIHIEPLPKGQSVTLKPKPGAIAKAIESIHVTESAPGQPERIEIAETSGGRMDIRFTPAAP